MQSFAYKNDNSACSGVMHLLKTLFSWNFYVSCSRIIIIALPILVSARENNSGWFSFIAACSFTVGIVYICDYDFF